MAQGHCILPVTWETWIEFLALGFSQAQLPAIADIQTVNQQMEDLSTPIHHPSVILINQLKTL